MTYYACDVPTAPSELTAALNKLEGEGWTLLQLVWAEPHYTAVLWQQGRPRGRRSRARPPIPPPAPVPPTKRPPMPQIPGYTK